MARSIRIEFENACYHVVAHGNEGRAIFGKDEDRLLFQELIKLIVQQYGVRVMSWVLMDNHYHLLVQTPRGNLTQAIGWLQTTYTIRFNQKYRRIGHLFRGRFKAHVIEPELYGKEIVSYMHLNPVRSKSKSSLIKLSGSGLDEYIWSSHRCYLGRDEFPSWGCSDWVKLFGTGGHGDYRDYMRSLLASEWCESPWKKARKGLALCGDILWERIQSIMKGEEEDSEGIRYERGERARHKEKLDKIMPEIDDWRVKIWARVRLGGERAVDLARLEGYRDGSGILQVVKRLERQAEEDPWMKTRLETLSEMMSEKKTTVPVQMHAPESLPVALL